jgi:hypothetical protein
VKVHLVFIKEPSVHQVEGYGRILALGYLGWYPRGRVTNFYGLSELINMLPETPVWDL